MSVLASVLRSCRTSAEPDGKSNGVGNAVAAYAATVPFTPTFTDPAEVVRLSKPEVAPGLVVGDGTSFTSMTQLAIAGKPTPQVVPEMENSGGDTPTTPSVHRPAAPFVPDNTLTFGKLDAVFKSGNATRDTIPSHLLVGTDISADVADFYARLCPAGVYERTAEGLRVNPPNCVDCKATDVLGPRWSPREGGSGPKYRLM